MSKRKKRNKKISINKLKNFNLNSAPAIAEDRGQILLNELRSLREFYLYHTRVPFYEIVLNYYCNKLKLKKPFNYTISCIEENGKANIDKMILTKSAKKGQKTIFKTF